MANPFVDEVPVRRRVLVGDEDVLEPRKARGKSTVNATNVGEAITALNMFGSENSSRVLVDGAELIRPPPYKVESSSWFSLPYEATAPCKACGRPWESSFGRHSRRCVVCKVPWCADCKVIYMQIQTTSYFGTNHLWVCKTCQLPPPKAWAETATTIEPPPPRPSTAMPSDDAVVFNAYRQQTLSRPMPGSTEPLGPRHTQEYCDL